MEWQQFTNRCPHCNWFNEPEEHKGRHWIYKCRHCKMPYMVTYFNERNDMDKETNLKVGDRIIEFSANGLSGDQSLEVKIIETMREYFLLWQQKQKSYGPHNIGQFGSQGCLIRSNDKIQRLIRHYFGGKDVSLSDESIEDTWKDLMGYAIMGLMCERGQWPGTEEK